MTAENPKSLGEALLELQADLPGVSKRQVAKVETQKGSYSYKYAGLAAVSAAILPRLNRLGLVFIARPTLVDGRPVLLCELLHVGTGEKLEAQYPIAVAPNSPAQAIGSAISYGRRYCLTAMVGVVAEDDDDGRAASIRYDDEQRVSRRRETSEPVRDRTLSDVDADADLRPRLTPAQSKRMHASFTSAGIKEREARLLYVAEVIGRTVESSSELTKDEAGLVIATLEAAAAEKSGHDEQP